MDLSDPGRLFVRQSEIARASFTHACALIGSFDDDDDALRSNRATAEYLKTLAANEGLDLQAATGNPTGGGIHMKLVLVQVDGETWTALGSLNGGEVSHKVNREVALMTDLPGLYDHLVTVFWWDWENLGVYQRIVPNSLVQGTPL